jgi:hypothetical protein
LVVFVVFMLSVAILTMRVDAARISQRRRLARRNHSPLSGEPPTRSEAGVFIDKTEIMALLLSRGAEDRAAWVDRVLPQLVDTEANASLLRLLEVDPSKMSAVSHDETASDG